MHLLMRTLQHDNDYWRIRDFVRQVLLINHRRLRSWHVARLDYWWARRREFLPETRMEDVVFIWETESGQIAAVLHPEHPGVVFQQVHPELRTSDLEEHMLAVAEEHLAVSRAEGMRRVIVVADQQDRLRQEILLRRGYTRFDHPKATEHQRQRQLNESIPTAPPAPGYTVRALREDEIPARGLAAWKTTRSDEPYDDFVGWKWLLNVYQAPLYRRDLDIVAVAPDGEIASFCTLWFDDVTRSGYFEPVGTAQEHQRRGLASAVMAEALHRLKRMGANLAFVSSYTSPAHELYASLGFSRFDLSEPWQKHP